MNECRYAVGDCIFQSVHSKRSSSSLQLDILCNGMLIDVWYICDEIEDVDR